MSAQSSRPFNVSYLVVGLVFLGIAGIWLLRSTGAVDAGQLGWLLPLTLVFAGVVGLVAFVGRAWHRGRVERRDTGGRPDGVDPEVARLEEAAYAPYPTDIERTRTIEAEPGTTTGTTATAPATAQPAPESHPRTRTGTGTETGTGPGTETRTETGTEEGENR